MSKLKQLRQQVIKKSAIAVGVVVVCFGVSIATGMLSESANEKKNKAQGALGQLQGELTTLNTQIANSGTAEKRFLEIASTRRNDDYVADSDVMKEFLRAAKENYRFADDFKLNLAASKLSDKPEFSGMNFDISIREPMRVELKAISDVHAYSFIQHLLRDAPGMIKVNRWNMKREKDIDEASIRLMSTGQVVESVETLVEFSWIGVAPKKMNPSDATAPSASMPGGPPPPMPGAP